LLGSATTTEFTLTTKVEATRAADLLEDRLRGPEPVTEVVVVQSGSLTVDDPAFREKVESVYEEIRGLGSDVVATARHYYQGNDEALVSADRRTTILPLVLAGTLEEATDNVTDLVEIVEHAGSGDGFRVLTVGTASIAHESNELAQEDLERGEVFGVPIAMLVLLFLFGAVVAALVPLGLALVSIAIALGIAALVGQAMDLIFFITLMITMIGLAVGIDYSLIIISRFREELDRGLDKVRAAERAGATAGRTVLFSGLTVVVALIGMLIVPASFFQSIGLGAIIVVLVALAATLTLLPALLALLGSNINRLSLPFVRRRLEAAGEASGDGFWEGITRVVVRYPVVSVIVVAAPLLAAAYFYFEIDTGLNGVDVFPEGAQTREAFFVLEEEFSFGLVTPAEIVIDGAVNSPAVREAINALQESIAADERYTVLLPEQLLSAGELALLRQGGYQILPSGLVINPAGDLALLSVAPPGEPSARPAVEAVEALRDEYIPAAFAGVGAEVYVGGRTALTVDIFDVVDTYTPIVFALVLGISFLILMLVFRSIVIPIKAIIMNLLSVGAAYGLLVLVFQKSGGIFGFQHAEAIDAWIPLFLFSILFGLSMDYHVFLLSRIRERYDETGDNAGAVSYGLRSTAGLITGAALIMVVVFGAFASGKTIINQQVGFGLAVAIFLDATLVRSVLVPASMELLGGRNWYLPRWLNWLPDLRIEAEESPAGGSAGQ
jgi:RND superfamily putative drug exporter